MEINFNIGNIDWRLLDKQKTALLNILGDENASVSGKEHMAIEGLVCLLDQMQDTAVEAGVPASEVFGEQCPECGGFLKPVMVDTDGTNLEEGYECPECGR